MKRTVQMANAGVPSAKPGAMFRAKKVSAKKERKLRLRDLLLRRGSEERDA